MKHPEIDIPVDGAILKGVLTNAGQKKRLIIFSHGSGSSRLSPRNRYVAEQLQNNGFATLLFDLLTSEEDSVYEKRFDIDLLAKRLVAVTRWIKNQSEYKRFDIGYFGASTGAASALKAAVSLGPDVIKALVSRGGRPDLADRDLDNVMCPVLLIVGEKDQSVIKLNREAFDKLDCLKQLVIIPGATHLFEEPGTLEQVTMHASDWFEKHLYRAIEKDFMT
jgi:putative phosphoribosyl transferase